jgi:hypothetical protein
VRISLARWREARGEASTSSDLDVFLVNQGTLRAPDLTRLDEILLKADLMPATNLIQGEFGGHGLLLTGMTWDRRLAPSPVRTSGVGGPSLPILRGA